MWRCKKCGGVVKLRIPIYRFKDIDKKLEDIDNDKDYEEDNAQDFERFICSSCSEWTSESEPDNIEEIAVWI